MLEWDMWEKMAAAAAGVLVIGLLVGGAAVYVWHTTTPMVTPEAALAPDLGADYYQMADLDPMWEPELVAILPQRDVEGQVEVLVVVLEGGTRARYGMARFIPNISDPGAIHLYLIDLTIDGPNRVSATYLGEVTGRFIYWSPRGKCWVQVPNAHHPLPKEEWAKCISQ